MYEGKENLKKEEYISKKLADVWGCSLYKAPISYYCDFFATRRERVLGMVELKEKIAIDKYDSLLSKATQAITAFNIAKGFNVPYIQAHYNLEKKIVLYKELKEDDFKKYGVHLIHTSNNAGRRLKDGDYPFYDFVLKIPNSEFKKVEF